MGFLIFSQYSWSTFTWVQFFYILLSNDAFVRLLINLHTYALYAKFVVEKKNGKTVWTPLNSNSLRLENAKEKRREQRKAISVFMLQQIAKKFAVLPRPILEMENNKRSKHQTIFFERRFLSSMHKKMKNKFGLVV